MKKITLILVVFAVILTASCNKEVDKSSLKTKEDSLSYAIGWQVGNGLAKDSLKINAEVLKAAMEHVLSGDSNKVVLKKEQIDKIFMALNQEMTEKRTKQMQAKAADAKKKGIDFLNKNKTMAGVKSTASGLQYKIDKEGNGPTPNAESVVKVHYRGSTVDGKVFDSSFERNQPAEIPLNGVIRGWSEGMQLLKVGTKATLYIPSELAYGDQGAGPSIGPGETLVFEVELLDIIKK
jgi:FKBP-type peptidyl-prolyl cis-trans isomerase